MARQIVEVSRKEVRKALAGIFEGAVPSANQIYSYQKSRLEGASPIVAVASAGIPPMGFNTRATTSVTYYLTVNIFVLHADAGQSWTEAMAEDALDDVELEVVSALRRNQRNTLWQSLELWTLAYVDRVVQEGVPYLMEVLPLEVTLI